MKQHRLTRLIAMLLLTLVPVFSAWGEEAFDWNRWAEAANTNPCRWFDNLDLSSILGNEVTATPAESATQSGCTWKSANGDLLVSAVIRSAADAAAVNAERGEQQRQIREYGTGRFEAIPVPHNQVAAIIRKDKLLVSLFANSDGEAVWITLNGHPVLRDTPDQRAIRKQRLMAFTEAVMKRFNF